jgi:hypothetical protein
LFYQPEDWLSAEAFWREEYSDRDVLAIRWPGFGIIWVIDRDADGGAGHESKDNGNVL